MVTLNSLIAMAGVTTPTMSAKEIREQSADVTSIVASERGSDIIELTRSFASDCIRDSAESLEILPLLSGLGGRDYSIVFMNDNSCPFKHFRARGVCNPAERSALLWMPSKSVAELHHEVFYRDDYVDVSALVRLAAPHSSKSDHLPLWASCDVHVFTPSQKILELIVNDLCAYARDQTPSVWKEATRLRLQRNLTEIGLKDSVEDVISFACMSWLGDLFDILPLYPDERKAVAQAWPCAIAGEHEIRLPYTSRRLFSLSVPKQSHNLAWTTRLSEVGVPGRYGDVYTCVTGILCLPDIRMLKNLFSQMSSSCEVLREDKSIWRDLGERAILGSLIRQREEFVLQ